MDKIQSLHRLANDPAASDGEKAAAAKALERLSGSTEHAPEIPELPAGDLGDLIALSEVVKWKDGRGKRRKCQLSGVAYEAPGIVARMVNDESLPTHTRACAKRALAIVTKLKYQHAATPRQQELAL